MKRTISDASLSPVLVNVLVAIRRYAYAVIYSKSRISEIIKKPSLGYFTYLSC